MITLIAESKTMSAGTSLYPPDLQSTPIFNEVAEELASTFAAMPVEEIAERIRVSIPLAHKAKRLFYDFRNGETPSTALSVFTGEVFRALDISSLDSRCLETAYSKVGIISSLYGLLRPGDLVRQYRFDFDVENPLAGITMQKYWKPKLTVALVKLLKERGEEEVLDLLPAEASKCLDWKLIKNFAKVTKINFKTINDNGELKTPHSGKIKELRGKLLREIIIREADRPSDVIELHAPFLTYDPDLSKKDYPTFIAF